MKKYGIGVILVIGVMVLVGLGINFFSNENVDVSTFDKAYAYFVDSTVGGLEGMGDELKDLNGTVSQEGTLKIEGGTIDQKGNISLNREGKKMKNFDTQTLVDFRGELNDSKSNMEYKSNGKIDFLTVSSRLFLNIKDFFLDLGKGNQEGLVINQLLSAFTGKRIEMDTYSGSALAVNQGNAAFEFPALFAKNIKQFPIFSAVDAGKTNNGVTSYELKINNENLVKLISSLQGEKIVQEMFDSKPMEEKEIQSFIDTIDFKGQLVVDGSDVTMVINNLSTKEESGLVLSGSFNKEDTLLSLSTPETKVSMNFVPGTRGAKLGITMDILNDSTVKNPVFDGVMNIKSASLSNMKYDGTILMKSSPIQDVVGDLNLEFEGTSRSEKIQEESLSIPTSSEKFSDLLGGIMGGGAESIPTGTGALEMEIGK